MAVVVGTAAFGFGLPAHEHVDGPPLGHSGGFEEPTCRECHFDGPLNESGGALLVEGLPERLSVGKRVRLHVVLRRPGLSRAGFQLTARFAEGERKGWQAGRFESDDPRIAVVKDTAGVHYVQHTRGGTLVTPPGEARWHVVWEPPSSGAAVRVHVAANAANDDDSEFGDRIYARQYTVAR